MSCPAAVTIDGTEYRCTIEPGGHVVHAHQRPDQTTATWRQDVTPSPPVTVTEQIAAKVPPADAPKLDYNIAYNDGRQAVLDALAEWEAEHPAQKPVDLNALGDAIYRASQRPGGYTALARAVVKHLGLEVAE